MNSIRTCQSEFYQISPMIIYKHRLLEFLTELQKSHSLIYKMLRRLPKSVLWIVVDDDYHDSLDTLTVEEFFTVHDRYHPRMSRFSVRFNTYLFRKEWNACGATWNKDEIFCGVERTECHTPEDLREIVDAFECILAYFLRESMQQLHPFLADDETCREYGLTEAESKELRELVEYANEELRNEFRRDTLRLHEIVCAFDKKNKKGAV